MNVIFRADAGSRIGTGHLMRSIALAQSWQAAGGAVVFVTNCESPALRERLKTEGFSVVAVEHSYPHPLDLEITRKVLADYPNAWCVVDGYNFDAGFQGALRQNGSRVLVVDDIADQSFYDADAILNQNINAADLSYNCPAETRLLLGLDYALLRKEFAAWQNWERETPEIARKILITMGGGDFDNLTLKAIRGVERVIVEDLHVKAVLGASNPHFAELQAAADASPVHIELIRSAENMAELMAWADAAVAASGSTCWELAFMRLPGCNVVLADNQRLVGETLDQRGVAFVVTNAQKTTVEELSDLIEKLIKDQNIRREMSRQGRFLVDGLGARRVTEIFKS